MLKSNNHYLSVLGQVSLDDMYIQQAFDYYRERYLLSKSAQDFVMNSSEIPDEDKSNRLIGYCDRTMGKQIPKRKTYEGGAVRGSLQRFGLIKSTGHELFRGCVVVPVLENNHVISAAGYRIASRIRHWEQPIIHWEKPSAQSFMDRGMADIRALIHAQAHN
jgi:hypothetical protein